MPEAWCSEREPQPFLLKELVPGLNSVASSCGLGTLPLLVAVKQQKRPTRNASTEYGVLTTTLTHFERTVA